LSKGIEQEFDKIVKLNDKAHHALVNYWKDNEIYLSLEFWMMIAILVVPLLVLFFRIDKSKLFYMGFYGYSIHMLFAYTDAFGRNMGYWNYPFPIFPVIPGLALDSSFVPVMFILIYQYTLNHKKNYYVYTIIAAAIFSFGFKPILVGMGLFKMYEEINYLHLFISFIPVIILGKFIVDVFMWVEKRYKKGTKSKI
jgi:hypothetical protein